MRNDLLPTLVEPIVRRVVRRGWMSRAGAAGSVILIIVALVVVPTTFGITLAAGQAVNYSQKVRENLGTLQAYITAPTPENGAKLKHAGRPWLLVGELALTDKKYAEASAAVAKILALDPFHPEAMLMGARVLMAKGEREKAVAELERAVKAYQQGTARGGK